MIFKIQIPLSTNEITPEAMVYNDDRSTGFMTPVENVIHLFDEGVFKIYVDAIATDSPTGWEMLVLEQVPDCDW